MARRGGSESGVTPLVTTLFLMGSAVVLGGGMYFATQLQGDGSDPPQVGLWPASDGSLRVVVGDPDADWSRIEASTNVPARLSLTGDPALSPIVSSGNYVPLATAPRDLVGGDELKLCTLGPDGPVQVTLRDARHHSVIFQQVLDGKRCGT